MGGIISQDDVNNFSFATYVSSTNLQEWIPSSFGPTIRLLILDIVPYDQKLLTLALIHQGLMNKEFDIFESLDPWPEFHWPVKTLRKLMNASRFSYRQRPNHYAYIRKRDEILPMHDNYLEWIPGYRETGFWTFWQNELWVFKNMCQPRIWQTKKYYLQMTSTIECHLEAVLTYSISSRLGKTGLLHDCMLLFTGRKRSSPDYNT